MTIFDNHENFRIKKYFGFEIFDCLHWVLGLMAGRKILVSFNYYYYYYYYYYF